MAYHNKMFNYPTTGYIEHLEIAVYSLEMKYKHCLDFLAQALELFRLSTSPP